MPSTKPIGLACLVAVLISLTPASATAATVEEVIAKNRQARGGKAWDDIRSMKVTGTFTSFSTVSPFTLHRARERRFHLDHEQNGRKVVIGFDGASAWWDNRWFQEGASPMTGPDLAAATREFDFVNALFDHAARGFEVELNGETEIEGIPAIGIELTRDDDSKETWYLDPETYLEVARLSPGSDFGQPMEQRTFFDDFRQVGGVTLPHLVEAQWYTRDRVMRIEHVEFNVNVDDALFAMPAPPGMGPLRPLVGKWKVAVSRRNQPDAPWEESEREADIAALLGGALVQEHHIADDGDEQQWNLSYDQFQKNYRLTHIGGSTRHMNVYEGTFDEDGRLTLSNVKTATSSKSFGMEFFSRVSFFGIGPDGFSREVEISIDGGENWFLSTKQSFSPAAP